MNKRYTSTTLFVFALFLSILTVQTLAQTVTTNPTTCFSLTSGAGLTYTQNFDTLQNPPATTGTVLPAEFGFSESGTNANNTYGVGTGSNNAGNTYSFGVAGTNPVTDRALGSLLSGSLTSSIYGACFTNNTGSTISSITVNYDGEQYRLGTNTAGRTADRLDFQYSLDATSLVAGTYVDVNTLDFNSPVLAGTAGVLDGNATANRTAGITSTVPLGAGVIAGSTFYIRYVDFDFPTAADDGLAVDNFNLTATLAPANPTAATVNVGGRVINSRGRAVGNARVSMTDASGVQRVAMTNPFGFYRFADVEVGQTIIFNARAKGYIFTEPTRVVTLNEEATDIDFTAYPSNDSVKK